MPMLITDFGGLYPKHSPRAMPNDGAQTANNLMSNIREFRPVAADVIVVSSSGVSNPKTIYRLQRNSDGTLNTGFSSAATWRVYAADVNLVKGQLNDDTTDRHYLSYNDGTTAPRVIDATGSDRQLGVPRPTTAPTVTVNVVDEFTVEERGPALVALRETAIQIIRSNCTRVWRGAARPGTSTAGYLDRSTANGFATDEPAQQVRAYRLTGATGTISNAYSSVSADNFSWVFDPALAAGIAQIGSGFSWATAGQYHVGFAFVAYGCTYDFDATTARSQLAALTLPGTGGTPVWADADLDDLIADITDYLDPAGTGVKPLIDALASAVARIKVLMDGGLRVSMVATTTAFYSKTDVAQAIADAKTSFCNAVWNAALLTTHSSLPITSVGPSPGDSGGASSGD